MSVVHGYPVSRPDPVKSAMQQLLRNAGSLVAVLLVLAGLFWVVIASLK